MQLDQTRIEDAIIAEVADKLMGSDDLYGRAKKAVEEKINRLWKEEAEARVRSEVEAAITAGFEREYQKTDAFGQKVGATTTIRAELERLIGGYWNERVGSDGKPTSSSYNTVTRAEWMMTKLCADDFAGQMKVHVINVGGALKDAFRKELHSTVNRMLSEVFHVRSLGDQGKGRETIDPVAKPVGVA